MASIEVNSVEYDEEYDAFGSPRKLASIKVDGKPGSVGYYKKLGGDLSMVNGEQRQKQLVQHGQGETPKIHVGDGLNGGMKMVKTVSSSTYQRRQKRGTSSTRFVMTVRFTGIVLVLIIAVVSVAFYLNERAAIPTTPGARKNDETPFFLAPLLLWSAAVDSAPKEAKHDNKHFTENNKRYRTNGFLPRLQQTNEHKQKEMQIQSQNLYNFQQGKPLQQMNNQQQQKEEDDEEHNRKLALVVDYTCKKDSDCKLKKVRNCCGTFVECVNKDYVPDLKAKCDDPAELDFCHWLGWFDYTHCICHNTICKGKEEPLHFPEEEP